MNKILHVKQSSHANMDSLPLRFGIHYDNDHKLEIYDVQLSDKKADFPDRYVATGAIFSAGSLVECTFVARKGGLFGSDSLITIWRHDADIERGLSETMRSLRESGHLTPKKLLKLHPDYVKGNVAVSADLIYILAKEQSENAIMVERMKMEAEAARQADLRKAEEAKRLAEEAKDKAAAAAKGQVSQYGFKFAKLIKVERSEMLSKPWRSASAAYQTITLEVEGKQFKVARLLNWRSTDCTIDKIEQMVGKMVDTTVWGTWSGELWFQSVIVVE